VCEGVLLRVVLSNVAFLGGIFERIHRLTVKIKCLPGETGLVLRRKEKRLKNSAGYGPARSGFSCDTFSTPTGDSTS